MTKICISEFQVVHKCNKCFDNSVFFVGTPIQLSVKGAEACKTFQFTGKSKNQFCGIDLLRAPCVNYFR